MAEVTQVAGVLDIKINKGDDVSILLDFDIDLTGYTFESKVDETDGGNTTITVVETNLATGQITLTMTDTLSDAIDATEDRPPHQWYLDRTNAGNQRRYLAGDFEVIEYK